MRAYICLVLGGIDITVVVDPADETEPPPDATKFGVCAYAQELAWAKVEARQAPSGKPASGRPQLEFWVPLYQDRMIFSAADSAAGAAVALEQCVALLTRAGEAFQLAVHRDLGLIDAIVPSGDGFLVVHSAGTDHLSKSGLVPVSYGK